MKHKTKIFVPAIALFGAMSLVAGGFALQIGKPSTNPEAQAKKAVLVVRGYACVAPKSTSVSATADGFVNGKRQSIPLKLIPLSGESTYALTRQWPKEGKWVITLVEANPAFGSRPSAIVKVDGDGVDCSAITRFPEPPSTEQVEAALNTTAVASKL
ncbi:MAG: hypothetical protein ACJ74Z_01670 [Bryobacteraceae bacterium]